MTDRTIFVVTESDDLPQVLRTLRKDGYRAFGVSDCESAEYILSTLVPDLVITDYPGFRTPANNQKERCLCASPFHRSARTLALLREGERELRPAAIGEGFHDAYVRPVAGPSLLPVIRDLLGDAS